MNQPIAKRYASAFFKTQLTKDNLQEINSELQFIANFLQISSEFNRFVENPLFKKDQKANIIKSMFQDKLSAPVVSFLLFLIHKDRLNCIKDICREFHQLYLIRENTVIAKIKTSVNLEVQQVNEICSILNKKFNKAIDPRIEVDKTLLGGIRIQIDDHIIDHSIRHQLDQFKQSLVHA